MSLRTAKRVYVPPPHSTTPIPLGRSHRPQVHLSRQPELTGAALGNLDLAIIDQFVSLGPVAGHGMSRCGGRLVKYRACPSVPLHQTLVLHAASWPRKSWSLVRVAAQGTLALEILPRPRRMQGSYHEIRTK